MRARMRRVLPLLLAAACARAGLVAPDDFPDLFSGAVCQVQARCRGESRQQEQLCEADARSVYAPDLAKALEAGKVAFDGQQAQICLDGLRARGCEPAGLEVEAACERTVVGTAVQGAPCSWLYECAVGRCEPPGPGACPATCGPVSGEGASCLDTPCDLRAGLRCIDNVCSKPHLKDQKCSSSFDCAQGLFCDDAGRCAARASEQASCGGDEQCAPGHFCDLGSEGGLCKKKIAQGQTCTASSAESIAGACAEGTLCQGFTFSKTGSTAGSCTPLGEVGAACTGAAQITGCAGGLVCAGESCAEKPVSGPCGGEADCREGAAWCDGAQCQALKQEGAPCGSEKECESRFCDPASGKCASNDPACHEP
jgi:hypothetical protein